MSGEESEDISGEEGSDNVSKGSGGVFGGVAGVDSGPFEEECIYSGSEIDRWIRVFLFSREVSKEFLGMLIYNRWI